MSICPNEKIIERREFELAYKSSTLATTPWRLWFQLFISKTQTNNRKIADTSMVLKKF